MAHTPPYKKVFIFILLISGIPVSSWNSQAEVYKWTDENGQVHFGDTRPIEIKSEQVTIKVNSYTSPSIEGLSKIFNSVSTSPQGSKNKKVVMYSASWCSICKKARKYFNQNDIAFSEYDIETSKKGRRDYKKLKGNGVPIILVNNKRMNGFSINHFKSLFK